MLAVAVNHKDIISFRLTHPILKMVLIQTQYNCTYVIVDCQIKMSILSFSFTITVFPYPLACFLGHPAFARNIVQPCTQ